MARVWRCAWLSLATVLVAPSCGGEDDVVPWRGPETHLFVEGDIFDESFAIDVTDPLVIDAARLECRREYEVPTVDGVQDLSQARNVEVRIRGRVTVNGEPRRFELELKRHDLQNTPIGTVLTIAPRDDLNLPDPGGNTLWVEWEWHDAETNETTFEGAAQGGTVRLEAFTGTPGPGGVIIPEEDGYVGATLEAFWSPTERLLISVSAPCLDTEIIEVTP